MNTDTRTNQLPTAPLAGPSFCEPGIPLDRNRDAPTVAKLDHERVLGDLNVLGRRDFRCQT